MTQLLPWWAKIAAKLVLARLPLGYAGWARLGLFVHGGMTDPAYARGVFDRHFRHTGIALGTTGWTALELGPGDSLASAVIAAAHGAGRIYLVDAGPFARLPIEQYRALADALRADGLPAPDLSGTERIEDVLARCGAVYLTGGLASLATIGPASVDFIFSQAVLEHVPRAEFSATLAALAQLTRPGGVHSHRIDLKDHLGGSLNNLRFPERLWEAPWFAARSGFYTNRLRASEIVAAFAATGLALRSVSEDRWPHLPLARTALHQDFRQASDADLQISGLDLVAIRS